MRRRKEMDSFRAASIQIPSNHLLETAGEGKTFQGLLCSTQNFPFVSNQKFPIQQNKFTLFPNLPKIGSLNHKKKKGQLPKSNLLIVALGIAIFVELIRPSSIIVVGIGTFPTAHQRINKRKAVFGRLVPPSTNLDWPGIVPFPYCFAFFGIIAMGRIGRRVALPPYSKFSSNSSRRRRP